jgi:hypothetical protein
MFIGNGMNYPLEFDPVDSSNVDIVGYVKHNARHLFDRKQFTLTIRESFICTMRKYLRDIFDFEVLWQEPLPDASGNYHIGSIGNAQQTLLGYKMTRVFGADRITYLSNTYMDSEYLYECGRGINEKGYE